MNRFLGYLRCEDSSSERGVEVLTDWRKQNASMSMIVPQADNKLSAVEWADTNAVLVQQSTRPYLKNKSDLHKQTIASDGVCAHLSSGCKLIGQLRIDNIDDIKQQLPRDMRAKVTCSQSAALYAYLHWGSACCDYLLGDFAFAVYDPRHQRFFIARDQLGVKPLYYYLQNGEFLFSNNLADLAYIAKSQTELSDQWLASYALGVSADWEQTPYRHICKLPPSHHLVIDTLAAFSLTRYFEFSVKSDLILPSEREYVEAYQEVLVSAVACRVLGDTPVAAELSGGLDSSSIAALAARTMRQPAKELHLMGFARNQLVGEAMSAIAQTSSVAMTHLLTATHNHTISDTQYSSISGAPSEHAGPMGHYPFYRLCQQLGVGVLLSGVGGDEVVSSEAPTAMVEFWNQKNLSLFYSRQRGTPISKPLHSARWLYHYYRYANRSISSRRLHAAGERAWRAHLLSDDIVEEYGLEKRFFDTLKYDAEKTSQNEFAIDDRLSAMLTTRLESSATIAGHFGVDYRYPLLDIRLLKLFLSMPASQKLGPGMIGRYLHRRAVSAILPSYITWGPKELVKHNWLKRAVQGQHYRTEVTKPNYLFTKKAMRGIQVPKEKHRFGIASSENRGQVSVAANGHDNISSASPLDPRLEPILDLNKLSVINKNLKNNDRQSSSKEDLAMLNKTMTLNKWLQSR